MTVKELREMLDRYRDDVVVILAKDREGNDFSPLAEHGQGHYRAETTWSGTVLSDANPGDATDSTVPCVVLWPVN